MPDWFRRRTATPLPRPGGDTRPAGDARPAGEARPAADAEREQEPYRTADVPAGLFVKCEKCGHIQPAKDFERDLKVCARCGHHHKLCVDERIAFTADPDSWVERDADLVTADPLCFPDYAAKEGKGRKVTGRNDALASGTATIGGVPCVLLVADFRFMGGSMGSVFGEKFARAAEYAIANRLPTVLFCASGGARMQEGLYGLMQMAKTSAAIAQLGEARLPYIAVLTDPTTGGAFASFASLGDVILAEPGAYIAFAGTRVAQQAQTHKPPPNYQTAEFQLEHGMIDCVVPRREMQATLARILAFFTTESPEAEDDVPARALVALDESVSRNGHGDDGAGAIPLAPATAWPEPPPPPPPASGQFENVLEFEARIAEVENSISLLREAAEREGRDVTPEVNDLERKRKGLMRGVFTTLSAWDNVLLARHEARPYTLDYVPLLFDDFLELHGDRRFADDGAMVGGLALFEGSPVVVVGQQKGRDLRERTQRNFGYPRPEGYRKALRLMKLAEKFARPVLTFVDTPGADANVPSEERGISEAIARNLHEMSVLRTPILSIIIGEGGSGGALGIAVADRVLMLQHAVYSVIAPEGCASILWRDPARKSEAAEAMRITALDAIREGFVDEVIGEPLGGAHRNPEMTAAVMREAISRHLGNLWSLPKSRLLAERYGKFRRMGRFIEEEPEVEEGAGEAAAPVETAASPA